MTQSTKYVITLGVGRVLGEDTTEEVCHSRVTLEMSAENAFEFFDNYLFVLTNNRLTQEQAAEVKRLMEKQTS